MLFDISIESLERIGYGCHGTAYAWEGKVLKVTEHPGEYQAAVRLMAQPEAWAAKVYAADAVEGTWRILKERVELIDFGEQPAYLEGHKEAPLDLRGQFFGIPYRGGDFAERASCPAEFCQGRMPPDGKVPCARIPLRAREMDMLLRLYDSPEQRDCFRWFMATYWDMRAKGYYVDDLYSNIARNAQGDWVNYDVMVADYL